MLSLDRSEKATIAVLAALLIIGMSCSVFCGYFNRAKLKVVRPDTIAAESGAGSGDIRVNINQAGAAELMRLRGVGKRLAERIIEYRSVNGSFFSVEDLKKVKGFGRAVYDKIKDHIYVE